MVAFNSFRLRQENIAGAAGHNRHAGAAKNRKRRSHRRARRAANRIYWRSTNARVLWTSQFTDFTK